MRRIWISFLLLVIPMLQLSLSVCSATVYVKADGSDGNSGQSWMQAKKNIQAGIDTASEGSDQVWVKAGEYKESIQLRPGVSVYGGFAGNETQLGQRDWKSNQTTIDADQKGCGVISPPGVTNATVFSGFTVKNGIGALISELRYGGGILCNSSSPTIAENVITGCSADYGAGICCIGSESLICNNLLYKNNAYQGGGLYLSGLDARILNNTIVYNGAFQGGCIYLDALTSSVIENNILAHSTYGYGVFLASENTGTPLIDYNCSYSNSLGNYDQSATKYVGTHGISSDAAFVDSAQKDYRISTSSPCVDTGNDTVVSTYMNDSLDLAGHDRVLGQHVDIGAYEYVKIDIPVMTPDSGILNNAQKISISCAAAGATIYYTTDGSNPTPAATRYTSEFTLNGNGSAITVKAIAVKTGGASSEVASETYTWQVASPVFSVGTGTYASAQSVKLSTATTGAVIYYTTDGTEPTASSKLYSGAIGVSTSQTIKAVALKTGYANSTVASAAFTIMETVATPKFSLPAGTYCGSRYVTISTATPDAAIYYTTDGSTPTESSPVAAGPICVSCNTCIKAIAAKVGANCSTVAVAEYMITSESASAPVLVTLSPKTGILRAGTVYTISAVYAHKEGYEALRECLLMINTDLEPSHAILLKYSEKTRRLYLRNDADTDWLGGYPANADKTVSNGQVKVYLLKTEVDKTPHTITVRWRISVKSGSSLTNQTCPACMYARDVHGSKTDWKKMGEFNIR